MAKKFSELRARMSPKAQVQSEAMTAKLLEEMPLQELRQALDLMQRKSLNRSRSNRPRSQRWKSRPICTSARYADSLPRWVGQLEIVARFPEGAVRITQFGNVDEDAPRARGSR